MTQKITLPLATALRESLARGYSFKTFKEDLLAAIIVSLVALPLSMALAIAVGLPPQNGIYTAIVAGFLAPLLGGSRLQVSGAAAIFVVIAAPIVEQYGLRGLVITEIMAGILLIALAWAKIGRFINFVPYTVTTGFTTGIAVVLGTFSLNHLLGLGIEKLQGSYIDKVMTLAQHLPGISWVDTFIGITSLLIMFNAGRYTRKVPSVILALLAGIVMRMGFSALGFDAATIGNHFSYIGAGGIIWHGLPPYPPSFHFFGGEGWFAWPDHNELRILAMPAVVIAVLAALESLLSATVADGLSRTRHNPNAELAGIGIGNIMSGLVCGMPATGAIARTTTNIKSGARTPLASAMHALLLIPYVWVLSPLLSYVPMASLAALLMLTAYNMSHYRQFTRILQHAPRQDVIVMLICFGLTVFVDMVAAVSVGMILAALLVVQRLSAISESYIEDGSEPAGGALPRNVMVYSLAGPLSLTTVERTLDRTSFLRRNITTLILDMQQVTMIDMTGLVAVQNLLAGDPLIGKRVIICASANILHQITQKLSHAGLQVETAPNVDAALALL